MGVGGLYFSRDIIKGGEGLISQLQQPVLSDPVVLLFSAQADGHGGFVEAAAVLTRLLPNRLTGVGVKALFIALTLSLSHNERESPPLHVFVRFVVLFLWLISCCSNTPNE